MKKNLLTIVLLVFAFSIFSNCSNPGKVRAIRATITTAAADTVDHNTPAVVVTWERAMYTNSNIMVNPNDLKKWTIVGSSENLKKILDLKGKTVRFDYRSIDEGSGLVLVVNIYEVANKK